MKMLFSLFSKKPTQAQSKTLAPNQDQLNKLLLEATHNGEVKKIDNLVQLGADIEAKTNDGRTPLHIALMCGRTDIVTKLIELGADIKAKTNDRAGDTPLHIAIRYGSTEIISKLIELGADIKAKTNDGRTPLHIALMLGRTEIVTKLIGLGVDIKAKTNDRAGDTPLHIAIRYGSTEIISKLIELGADIKAKTNDGWAPLHIALMWGRTDIVTKLIELGADIKAETNDGRTPLHIAAEHGGVDTVIKLLELGANIEAKDNDGNSPLSYAEKKWKTSVVTLLRNWDKDKKNTLTQVAISKVLAEKAPEKVLGTQNNNEVGTSPQLLQKELEHPEIATSTIEPSAQLQKKNDATEEASFLINTSSTESENPTIPSLPQSELPKLAEEIHLVGSASQASEKSLPQADITALKMNALLSLQEQQTKLAAEIQKLQELTQTMHSASPGKMVSLTPEQEAALNKLAYKQGQLKELEQLKTSPNLAEFYQTFVINIEALFLAIKTAQTNLMKIQLQGNPGKAAQVSQALGGFLEAIPVIGNTAKSVSNVVTKLLAKFDEHQIAQKLKQLHELGTQKQWQSFTLELAKFLTLRYEDQLVRLLATPTKTAQESPGRALANYVVMSLFDHLMSYPVTVTNILISSRPVTLTFEKVKAEFLEKLAPRSQSTITELGLILLSLLNKDTVIMDSGKKFSLQAVLTKPGIRVEDTEFFDHDAGKLTHAAEYGYRFGTEQEALQYKLIKSTNKAPHLSAKKATVLPSSSMLPSSTSQQQSHEVRDFTNVANVSSQNGSSAASNQALMEMQATLMQMMQSIEALKKSDQEKMQSIEALEKSNQEKDREINSLKQRVNQSSPNSWVGRVYEVPVGNQLFIQKEVLQSTALSDATSPQLQAQKIAILEARMSYTEQVVSNLNESVETTAKMAMGIHTSSILMIEKTTANNSQKGASPSK